MDNEKSDSVVGQIDDGAARIEDPDNEDAWIEAEYRDGWVGRKLLGTGPETYKKMIHPYYLKCCRCLEIVDTQYWGINSPYCPGCEQYYEHAFPMALAGLFDGEWEKKEELTHRDI